jgi:acetyltransferase
VDPGLDAIFSPKSVAVIGASRRRGKVGYAVLRNLIVNEYQGTIYPVNPKAHSIHGIKAYPTVLDIPDDIDMAIITVPAAYVLQVVEECGKKGVKGLVVITAGFRETGAEGTALEQQLMATVRRHGMRMVGPNCMGVLNMDPEILMDATFAPTPPLTGDISFMTQSGALGVAILDHAKGLNIGFAKFCSLGNKPDVSGNDLVRAWGDDPQTKMILMYIESFGNPGNYVRIAKQVAKRKPIIGLKSGRTEQGARSALSHTGALGGSDAAVDAIFAQTGTLRVDSIEELFNVAMAFSLQDLPRGDRVAIVTDAGGPAVMCTDQLVSLGLQLAEFTDDTLAKLREIAPAEASVKNPVDLIAEADAELYHNAMDIVLADPNVDSVIVIYVPPVVTEELLVAQRITDAAAKHEKTVLCNFLGRSSDSPGFAHLVSHNIPAYLYPEDAATALAAMVRYGHYRERPEGQFREFDVDKDRVARILEGAAGKTRLGEQEALDLLAAYGLDVVKSRRVSDLESAVSAAGEIGYPVVLKGVSQKLVHKSDAGAVVLDIEDEPAFRREFEAMRGRLQQAGFPAEGYVVQEFAPDGRETIVGMQTDQKFGPMLMFGLGGIYVEHLKDVSWARTPITDSDAERMVRSIQTFPILEGVRGEKPSDIPAIEETLLRISQIVEDHPTIREIDVNPLLVRERGRGAKIVDVRVVL